MDFSRSNELRARAHQLIPGGAHTYAKGDDQFPEARIGDQHGALGKGRLDPVERQGLRRL